MRSSHGLIKAAFTNKDVMPSGQTCWRCDCCPIFWTWRQARRGHSARWEAACCRRCDLARKHSFWNHQEYEVYLAKGCWIDGGLADRIDHDHDIHPQNSHSCEECRRGPICHEHNMWLQKGRTADDIYKNALKYRRSGEQGLIVAEIFRAYERDRSGIVSAK